MKKRLLAFMLSVMMIITYMPAIAFAAEEGDQTLTADPEVMTTEAGVDIADSDELLMDYMERSMEVQTRAGMLKASRNTRGNRLEGHDRVVYDLLKEQLSLVASGDKTDATITIALKDIDPDAYQDSYTAEDLGVDAIIKNDDFTAEALDAMDTLFSYDFNKVFNALLADMPYELYWFDKTKGCVHSSPEIGASGYGDEWTINFSYPYFTFYFSGGVAEEYRGDQIGTVDDLDLYAVARTDAVSKAIDTAQKIRDRYANASDLNKLIGYKDEICNLASYNDYAADPANNTPYGNPWQMIWVFDGDSNTKVVCEGYAKAFQFLCDNTSALQTAGIECDSVTGTMVGGTGEGPHMWNILHMDDGRNYIADITNSDDGTVGDPDQLFLKGYSGVNVGGYDYTYKCSENDISYSYDEETWDQFTKEELEMSDLDYNEVPGPAHEHPLTATAAKAATCTEAGNNAYWECEECGKYFSDAEGTKEIAKDSWVIKALGHKWGEWTQTKSPTCSAKGEEEHVCANDPTHKETRKVAINADAHTWDEGKVTTEPTCTASGVKSFTCKNDASHTKTEAIAASGHNLAAHAAKAATETAEGNSAYWSCSACGKFFSDKDGKTEIAKDSWVIPKGTPAEPTDEPSEEEKAAAKAKEDLSKAVDDAKKVEQGNYTDESYKVLKDAIAEAEALAKDEKATKAQLDAAAAKIAAAKAALKEKESVTPAEPTDEEKAAAEEQARQGVYDKTIPKIKAKKPSAKKTSITMKWTKLTKKQLKKSKATKYEIWLCPNTKFAKEDTIEKIVSKSKSSYTFKKLKKNTKYYVKVRAIKYVDGVKHVGKWSSRKTIKTKKK